MASRNDIDALVEQTMAFVKGVNGTEAKPVVPLELIEQALADSPIPVERSGVSKQARLTSESEEIKQRVLNFKAHQEKVAREREDYYLQMKAKTRALIENRLKD